MELKHLVLAIGLVVGLLLVASTEFAPVRFRGARRLQAPTFTPTAAPTTSPTPSPTTEAPTTEAPTTEAPTTEAPTTEAPTTEAPTTEAPTTEAPTTEAPTTEAPTTEAPTTEAPVSVAPSSDAPTTEAPTTEAPVSVAPSSDTPTTEAPVTLAPVTLAPVTSAPVTSAPVASGSIPKCRVPENNFGTTPAQCKKLRTKVQNDATCAESLAISAPVDIGYGATCINPCAARAYLKCSNQMKAKKKVESFSCYQSKSAEVNKLLKKLIKQECKKVAPWFRDGGCKNSDGVGRHGCSTIKCPVQCMKLASCVWSLPGTGIVFGSFVDDYLSNPVNAYPGSCIIGSRG